MIRRSVREKPALNSTAELKLLTTGPINKSSYNIICPIKKNMCSILNML